MRTGIFILKYTQFQKSVWYLKYISLIWGFKCWQLRMHSCSWSVGVMIAPTSCVQKSKHTFHCYSHIFITTNGMRERFRKKWQRAKPQESPSKSSGRNGHWKRLTETNATSLRHYALPDSKTGMPVPRIKENEISRRTGKHINL